MLVIELLIIIGFIIFILGFCARLYVQYKVHIHLNKLVNKVKYKNTVTPFPIVTI